MLLASGICPTLALQQAGCPVGLAVDGSASNDCSNMAQEMRQALLQQRLRYITAEYALTMATKGSASLFRRTDIGEIVIGKQADLALFSLDELRFSVIGDPMAARVTCRVHQVDKLMVAGQWVIENGQHHAISARELMMKQKRLATKLQGAY
jgi:8-oxoguanine deaminase